MKKSSTYGSSYPKNLRPKTDFYYSSIDLFEIGDTLLVSNEEVEAGNYDKVIIVLESETPFEYLPDGVNKKPMRFQDESIRAIKINQDFVVSSDAEEGILLEFDALSSISESKGEFIFKPRVRPHRKRELKSYEGVLEKDGGVWVCGYVYAPQGLHHEPPPVPPEGGMHEGMGPPPPPPNYESEHPPRIASSRYVQAELAYDDFAYDDTFT